jgi:hypothetical protein
MFLAFGVTGVWLFLVVTKLVYAIVAMTENVSGVWLLRLVNRQ